MAISRNRKFIFIKINKTGGTSVQQRLGKLAADLQMDGHRAISDYDVDLDQFFKFAFVRNPWDKMVSFYAYHAERGFDLLSRPCSFWSFGRARQQDPSFREFILRDIHRMRFSKPKGKSTQKMRTSNQLDWLTDNEGRVAMDFIGRFETLQEDFDTVCARLDLPSTSLRRINA